MIWLYVPSCMVLLAQRWDVPLSAPTKTPETVPTFAYKVNHESRTLRRRSDSKVISVTAGEKACTAPRAKRASKLAEAAKHWAERGPCKHRCAPETMSRAGSNHIFIRNTCLVCGQISRERREPEAPTTSAAECSHENVDHRGSSRSTHRVFCLDCLQTVYECPQEEHRRQKDQLHTAHLRGRTQHGDLHGTKQGPKHLTREQAIEVAARYKTSVKMFLRGNTDEQLEVSSIVRVLKDTVVSVLEDAESDGEVEPTAFMHVTRIAHPCDEIRF